MDLEYLTPAFHLFTLKPDVLYRLDQDTSSLMYRLFSNNGIQANTPSSYTNLTAILKNP